MKYIIKKCPCFIDFDEQSLFENLCKNGGNCYDCTDCVLQQIYEKCKDETIPYLKNERLFVYNTETNKHEYVNGVVEEYKDGCELAESILDLLQIQKVE